MSIYSDLKLDVLYEAIKIKEEIQLLENRLAQLFGSHPPSLAALPAKKGRGKMSAAGRASIVAAQKARWAKVKGVVADAVEPVASALKKTGRKTISAAHRAKLVAASKARWAKIKGTAQAPAAKPAKAPKKGGLTPEGRAKLAAAMKARWAARKKGAPALNAKKANAGRKRIAIAGQPKFKIV